MTFEPGISHLNTNVIKEVEINYDLMSQNIEAGEVLKRVGTYVRINTYTATRWGTLKLFASLESPLRGHSEPTNFPEILLFSTLWIITSDAYFVPTTQRSLPLAQTATSAFSPVFCLSCLTAQLLPVS